MNDKLKLTGSFIVELHDEHGNLKEREVVKNTVVTAGLQYLAAWLSAASQAGSFMPYIALGTGTTAATVSDTALQTELSTRVLSTISNTGVITQRVAVFGAGVNTGAVSEAGIFSASSGGTMLARQVFGVKNKGVNDSLTFTWQIALS